ncbi:OmpA family protein [bacterium]|nr:OmpA family protein [bacterium]
MRRVLIIVLLLAAPLFFAEADMPSLDIFSKSIGEAAVTYGYSFGSYYYNPANITYFNSGGFSVFSPALSYNEEAWDLYDFYLENKDRFEGEDFDPMTDLEWEELEELLSKDPLIQIQVPLNFLMITKPDRWGLQTLFGLNMTLNLATDIQRGVMPPISSSISALAMGDILIPLGIAGKLKIGKLLFRYGATFKYIHREKVELAKELAAAVLDYVPVRYSGNGFGVDAGTAVEINDLITVGAALRNIGGMRFTWTAEKMDDENTAAITIDTAATFVKPDLSIGITYFPKIKGMTKIIDNNFISLAFNDILAPHDYFLNHIKLGFGTRIMKVFNLYLGLNGGYPTAGVNIDLWVFHLSYSFYSIELGKFPGQIRDSRQIFSLSFSGMRRPQTKEEALRKDFGAKKEKKKDRKQPGNLTEDKTEKKEVKKEKPDPEAEAKIQARIKQEQLEAEKRKLEEKKKNDEEAGRLKKLEEEKRLAAEKQKAEELRIKKEAQNELKNLSKPVTTPVKKEVKKVEDIVEEEIIGEETIVPKEEILEETQVEKESVVNEIKSLNYSDVDSKQVKVVLNIRFASGSTQIPESGKSDLYTLLNGLHKTKGKIKIYSYTDSSGSDAINLKYSQLRADEVRLFLVKNGIDPARVTATGYGETNPIADNTTKEGRARNRRIEVSFQIKE